MEELYPRRSGPVAQLGARFHGMEEVIGSIPIRSTKQPLTNQAYAGSVALPPFGDLVSFGVTRAEGLRRLMPAAPVRTDLCGFLRFRSKIIDAGAVERLASLIDPEKIVSEANRISNFVILIRQ
jgi:hypothetical protein